MSRWWWATLFVSASVAFGSAIHYDSPPALTLVVGASFGVVAGVGLMAREVESRARPTCPVCGESARWVTHMDGRLCRRDYSPCGHIIGWTEE